jgi:CheY-like chemotaxis protein
VKQIITNLVSNAVKFTTRGFVSLTVARSQSADGAPALRFTVEDTGVGFAPEARERLFTRFEQADDTITRRYGGTGLGLAICRQLAEMMQGDLDCESEPGGGSAFILTLPLIEAEAPAAVLAPAAGVLTSDPQTPLRVLMADDHPTNRRVVELILAQANVVLTSVENGAEAVAAFRNQTFDLVLMDMQMPVMDGLTATREIRDYEALMGADRTPVVMLTANALAEHVAASLEAGADSHLSKPFSAEDLLGLVADAAAQVGERLRAAA